MSYFCFDPSLLNHSFITCCPSAQGDDPFGKRKSQDKPARAPRIKTRVTKRPEKKKTTEASDLPNDEELDDPESEVELDSLGSFFIHLIDNDYYQDDAEGSQADDVEVIILSSDSDPLPT